MIKDVQKKIGDLSQKIGLLGSLAGHDIASSAVNDTAFYCRIKTIEFMKNAFDKPVGRTLSSTLIKPLATPNKPEAEIFINDDSGKGNRPSNWLRAQVEGGQRKDKGMERALKIAGILPEGMQVRGVAGELDGHGNLPARHVKQMLNELQGINTGNNPNKWHVARRISDGKAFGVFRKKSRLFLTFTRKHRYDDRYPFHEIIKKAWDKKLKENYQRRFTETVGKLIGQGI